MKPLQLVSLANDHCDQTALIVNAGTDRMALRVAAASFAETYVCPDPTCSPVVGLTADDGITTVTVRHVDWCAELRRRTAKARARQKRRGNGKRR